MSKTIVTHDAKFHADDVFAVATLLLLEPEAKVVRTRDESLIESADYVVDVGRVHDPEKRRFDHHQPGGAGVRENGIPYASFGLVWKEHGEKLVGSSEGAGAIDRMVAQGIDSGDVGFDTFNVTVPDTSLYLLGDVVDIYRSTWKEEQDWDERFARCVEWAKSVLERQIKIVQDEVEAERVVRSVYEAAEDKRLIIFDEMHTFGREIIGRVLQGLPDPVYAVLVRPDHGNWQLLSIRKESGTFASRKPLPSGWRGMDGEELQSICGVSDAVFCHNSGFMCVAKTKEGALELARKALEA